MVSAVPQNPNGTIYGCFCRDLFSCLNSKTWGVGGCWFLPDMLKFLSNTLNKQHMSRYWKMTKKMFMSLVCVKTARLRAHSQIFTTVLTWCARLAEVLTVGDVYKSWSSGFVFLYITNLPLSPKLDSLHIMWCCKSRHWDHVQNTFACFVGKLVNLFRHGCVKNMYTRTHGSRISFVYMLCSTKRSMLALNRNLVVSSNWYSLGRMDR